MTLLKFVQYAPAKVANTLSPWLKLEEKKKEGEKKNSNWSSLAKFSGQNQCSRWQGLDIS